VSCLVGMKLLVLSVSLTHALTLGNGCLNDVDAFIRDELSKGRYDPAITKICFEILLELFGRTLKLDLGAHDGVEHKIEDIC
jgi:hypothetical protein